MDDLIRRQDAITLPVMPKEYREYQTSNLDDAYEQGWNDLQKCIESLPSEQQWIPCSERLPHDERKVYWICLDTGGQRECRWTNNKYGLGESDMWGWSAMDIPMYTKVIAWMPLPEPYRGENDG